MRGLEKLLILFAAPIWSAAIARCETNSLSSLVETSAKRLLIAKKVALAKWDSGAAVEDAPREAEVIRKAVKDAEAKGLDAAQVEDFLRAQIEANKLVQYSLLADWRRHGKAPPHAPVDVVKEIRPQLDQMEKQLISGLLDSAAERSTTTCRADVAKAVGDYLDAHKLSANSRNAVALDRAMATTWTNRGE